MKRVIKSTALARLKETYKSGDVVLAPLTRHVMRQGDSNPHTRHFMHPSDMAKPEWCGRHDFYRIIDTPEEKVSEANPSFKMTNAFAEGHTIHGKYQTWLWEMGVLYGEWYCRSCGEEWTALSPPACPSCDSLRVTYNEVPLHRTGYLIEGHADGGVHNLGGFTGLVEIKSIGVGTLRFEAPRLYNLYKDEGQTLEDIWFKIGRPFRSHLKQGMLYLWLSWPRYERIVFIYESKFHQQTKEFVVEYNPTLIAPILEVAKEVSQGVRSGIPPDRPEWAESEDAKHCRSCAYRQTCWQLGSPSVTTPTNHPEAVGVKRVAPAKRKRVLSKAQLRLA